MAALLTASMLSGCGQEPETGQEPDTGLQPETGQEPETGFQSPPGWAFVPIPAGSFTMGSPAEEIGRRLDNESPQHEVTLTRDFWMGQYAVTQRQYEEVMGRNPSEFKEPDRPVEMVSWEDAQDFLRKMNEREHAAGRLPKTWRYRLPTEAEWEYACRAGTKTRFYWGDDLDYSLTDQYAFYKGNSGGRTHAVGQKKPNAWGLYDMSGNVYEWCGDWYADDYSSAEQTDPQGPSSGFFRVLRGGSYVHPASFCRSADRFCHLPDYRGPLFSFRILAVPAAGGQVSGG